MALHAIRQEGWARAESSAPSVWAGLGTRTRAWMLLAVAGWGAVAAVGLVAATEWRKAEQLAQVAGMTAMSGRGMELVISDPGRAQQAGGEVVSGGQPVHASPLAAAGQPTQVVTDGDLILLNMLLWYGGARAVAINNQRITAQTTITSSGPVILINGTRLVAPFRVTALGDPETLKGVLGEAGLIEQMRGAGFTVTMSPRSALRVPPWQPGVDATH